MNLLLRRSRTGFTLIELLVVIAIISVLMSILLPSLNNARKIARRVVDQSNMRQIGAAGHMYSTEGNEWIAGAPNGSGFPAFENVERPERVPTTVFDWANPLLKFLGRNDMHPDRISRMALSRQGIFKCPENKEVMRPFQGVPANHPNAIQDSPSYITNWKFLCVGDNYANKLQYDGGFQVPWIVYGNWETTLPGDYQPKLNRVGLNSRKIFLMDGARYVNDGGDMDYDARLGFYWGTGSYCGSGSSYRDSREYGLNKAGRPLSYRHTVGSQLGANAVFFDGHAEFMLEKATRYLPFTSPTGSRVSNISSLHPDAQGLFSANPTDPTNVIPD